MRSAAHRLLLPIASLAVAGLIAQSADAATLLLQNDGFTDMASVGFQSGFTTGEQGAVTLGPVAESFALNKVMLLFGAAGGDQTITLHIFQDNGGAQPGTEVFSADYQLTPSADAMQEIDLTADNIMLAPGSFRVSVEFQHTGQPSIARDDDGSIMPNRNWINAGGIGWVSSETLGLQGDWIIRAEVNTVGGATGATTGATTGSGAGGGMGVGGNGAGTGSGSVCTPGSTQECVGPGACAGGQSCNADGTGFSVCECAGDTAEDDGGSGCSCAMPGDPFETGSLAAFSLLGMATFLRHRKKRRATKR